jgi:hypothetical protein
MELANPFRIRLATEHLIWLDSRRSATVTSRAQALRLVLDEAMKRDQRRQKATQRRAHGPNA